VSVGIGGRPLKPLWKRSERPWGFVGGCGGMAHLMAHPRQCVTRANTASGTLSPLPEDRNKQNARIFHHGYNVWVVLFAVVEPARSE
jgi:hypothetical protein